MAITRAQQFRQMLEDGGMLVKPGNGKRPGYRGDAAYGDRTDKEAIGDGKTSSTGVGGQTARTGPGNKTQAGGTGGSGSSGGSKSDKPSSYVSKNQIREIFKLKPGQKIGEKYKPTLGDALGNLSLFKFGKALKDSEFNKRRRANFMKNLDALSNRFQTRRNINLPFGISFDANARINNNLLQNLLNEAQEDLGLVAMSPGPFDYMNKRAISLSDLPKDKQEEIYDKVMDARMAGQTDAAGNLKAGFMFDSQGNIISTGNDGRDTEAERLALLAQTANQNQATTPTKETPAIDPIFYRLAADGGMIEDAPVGGIMDLESGRQMYFLGKLVKKATRAVKKIAKSPIGKAALLGFGANALMSGGLGTFLKTKAAPFLFKGGKEFAAGKMGLGKLLSSGLTGGGMLALGGALTAAPFLFGKEEEDQTIDPALLGERLNIARLLANPYQATLGQGYYASAADGGRIGYSEGSKDVPTFREFVRNSFLDSGQRPKDLEELDIKRITLFSQAYQDKYGEKKADGGIMRIGYQEGSKEPVAKKTMPLLDMDGQEMDLRDNGGFVPIGRMEKADDVPARLSKNEFVFTADAVRNAGDGDIDKGAEVMYNMMKNLEDGGNVSEESQGLEGARNMFQTAQRLEEVL